MGLIGLSRNDESYRVMLAERKLEPREIDARSASYVVDAVNCILNCYLSVGKTT
jgi:hypothetical protein